MVSYPDIVQIDGQWVIVDLPNYPVSDGYKSKETSND